MRMLSKLGRISSADTCHRREAMIASTLWRTYDGLTRRNHANVVEAWTDFKRRHLPPKRSHDRFYTVENIRWVDKTKPCECCRSLDGFQAPILATEEKQ